jgi:hypothetical protein
MIAPATLILILMISFTAKIKKKALMAYNNQSPFGSIKEWDMPI